MTHGFDTSFLVAHEVACHPDHAGTRARLAGLRAAGDRFGLTSQVLTEFIHVVTDAKRFTAPLTIEQAIDRSRAWWDSPEVEHIAPDDGSVKWLLDSMTRHHLGRKRVLDTMLAATYRSAKISSILTLNSADFSVFGESTCLGALAMSP